MLRKSRSRKKNRWFRPLGEDMKRKQWGQGKYQIMRLFNPFFKKEKAMKYKKIFIFIVLGIFFVQGVAMGANCPDGMDVAVSGDAYVEVGATIDYTCEGSPEEGTFAWTCSDGLEITDGETADTAIVEASDTPSGAIGVEWVNCEYTVSGTGDEEDKVCEDEMEITIYDPMMTAPIDDTIHLTTDALSLTGSLGDDGLDDLIFWKSIIEDSEEDLGTGTPLSTTVSEEAAESELWMYVGEDAESAIQTSVGITVYLANAATGAADDIYPGKIAWSLTETDVYEIIADRAFDALEALNDVDGSLYPERYRFNEENRAGAKGAMVTALSSASDSAWSTDLRGQTIDTELSGSAGESGLFGCLEVDYGVKADWAKVILGQDFTDISLTFGITLEVEVWGGTLEGGADFEYDPFGEDPDPQFLIQWGTEL